MRRTMEPVGKILGREGFEKQREVVMSRQRKSKVDKAQILDEKCPVSGVAEES